MDGTYELFRHFFGQPSRTGDDGDEIGAARGVLLSIVSMLADGATHVGVATDHVIESFRNDLWPGYKTGAGIDPVLRSQFDVLETALTALGVAVWPMVDLEADDALASAASVVAEDPGVAQVIICTPDKDLAQCVVGTRVVQLDRRKGAITDENGVWTKFGVAPRSIPDWLGLVGDSADGFPGLTGWGRRSASAVLAHYGSIDDVPDDVARWDPAVRQSIRGRPSWPSGWPASATGPSCSRTSPPSGWTDLSSTTPIRSGGAGPTGEFEAVCRHFRDPGLADRAAAISTR